jgi:cytidine deaminase
VQLDSPDVQRAFDRLPPPLRARLAAAPLQGMIRSEGAAECLAELGWEIERLMMALLPLAAAHAQSPVSNFSVGAVALGMPPAAGDRGPGSLYFGANMEFSGAALPFTIHAEQSATNNAWLHGETGVRILAVNAAPCGICRQFLNELTTAATSLRVIHGKSAEPTDNACGAQDIATLLPQAFGPGDLGIHAGLMRTEDHRLALETKTDSLAQAALAAANASYAPYTKAYAGVALRADGATYAGRYAENAAFNPSLLPVQSALAFMRMKSGAAPGLKISEAALVEVSSERTRQRDVTRLLLETVSPGTRIACYEL